MERGQVELQSAVGQRALVACDWGREATGSDLWERESEQPPPLQQTDSTQKTRTPRIAKMTSEKAVAADQTKPASRGSDPQRSSLAWALPRRATPGCPGPMSSCVAVCRGSNAGALRCGMQLSLQREGPIDYGEGLIFAPVASPDVVLQGGQWEVEMGVGSKCGASSNNRRGTLLLDMLEKCTRDQSKQQAVPRRPPIASVHSPSGSRGIPAASLSSPRSSGGHRFFSCGTICSGRRQGVHHTQLAAVARSSNLGTLHRPW